MLGYPKDWVLSDLKSKLNNAFWLMPATPTYVHYGVPYITSKNIKDGKINFLNSDKITYADYYKVSNLRKIEHNDILITMIGTIGEIGIVDSDLDFYGQNIYLIRPNKQELDSNFFYYLFNLPQNKESILNNKGGSTQGYLRADSVIEKKYYFPNINEQKAIAKTLMTFDRHIETLERLIEKKKMVRNGAVEDLMTGKIRLDGFEDKWEDVKLSDLTEILTGLTYSPEDVKKNGVLVLRSSNIQNDKLVFNDNVYVDESKIYSSRVKVGDIIMCVRNGSFSLIGKTAIVREKIDATFGAFMSNLRCYDFLSKGFIYYFFKTSKFREEVDKILGATINQITKSDLNKLVLTVPTNKKEQEAIASILTSMDKEIENLEKEKAKIEKIKAGAIDDLLTGKVRLI